MHSAFGFVGFLDLIRVVVQSDKVLIFTVQEAPDGLTDPAKAADHHMPLQLGTLLGDFFQLGFFVRGVVQAGGDARGGA